MLINVFLRDNIMSNKSSVQFRIKKQELATTDSNNFAGCIGHFVNAYIVKAFPKRVLVINKHVPIDNRNANHDQHCDLVALGSNSE